VVILSPHSAKRPIPTGITFTAYPPLLRREVALNPEIAFDDYNPKRANYRQAPLTLRLREAIHKLNRLFLPPFQCQKWLYRPWVLRYKLHKM
jgi:hypothetical protein